ncbi:LPS export ABC transporter permease LptF [Guyparkeria halophila]|uniref:Lipopolysaccharide export system permease protein LptF n=1 Tax=Guyparkeria halophila TaxID=47960 RepID=A0A6I6D150_9GAMM|nr:LPS export ABC transporter permease LptF [Guyparkeria halophila]QGT77995.1 LPS export ABC transporter permease LptF [Guyparkeria halophila]
MRLAGYLRREALISIGAVTTVLMLIMATNLLARALSLAADGTLPAALVPNLLGFNLVKMLMYVVPVATFIGLMFALGRLNRDSEQTIMRSSGFGLWRITGSLLPLGIPLALLTAWISLFGWPMAEQARDRMVEGAQSDYIGQQVPVGRFIEANEGRLVAYVGASENGGYQRIFLFDRAEDGSIAIESAPSGVMVEEDGQRYIALEDGRRIGGTVGAADWNRLDYERHLMRLPGQTEADGGQVRVRSSGELWASGSPNDHAELFERLSQGIIALVLVLIAIPLAQAPPRSGRYGRLFWAFLIYALYFNVVPLVSDGIEANHYGLAGAVVLAHGGFLLLWGALFWSARGGWGRLRSLWKGRREYA